MTTETAQSRVLRVLLLGERVEEFRHVRELLHDQGDFHVHGARDAADAKNLMAGATYDTVLVDAEIWEESGSALLESLREHQPDTAIVVITEDESTDERRIRGAHEVVRRQALQSGEQLALRIAEAGAPDSLSQARLAPRSRCRGCTT